MHRRQWDAKTNTMLVLKGLKGKPVADICTGHQISQSLDYQWRDQFLAHASKAFEVHHNHQQEARLEREHARLKKFVGELVLGFKKKRRGAGMSRQTSPLVAQHHDERLRRIQALKAEHPCWGYRRIWAYLRFVAQQPVNHERMLRRMQAHHLVVQPNLGLKAKRTPTGSKPRPTKPNEWWGMDMTKVLVQGGGWVYIVVVLEWCPKAMVGHYAGVQCLARDGLAALDGAVNT